MVLERYQQANYRLHLDGFQAEIRNVSSLGEMILDFPNLIKTNKVVQSISGVGIALIVVVIVMIVVCCVCSEKCRSAARACLCCCCQWREAVGATRARLERERASWEEYQLIRQAERAHHEGKDLPRWGTTRGRRGRAENLIESAPAAP